MWLCHMIGLLRQCGRPQWPSISLDEAPASLHNCAPYAPFIVTFLRKLCFTHSTASHCFCTSTALPLHFSSCSSASDFLSSLPRSGFRHLPFRSMFTLLVLPLLLALCFQPASATSPSLGFVDPAAIMSSPYPDPGSMLFGNICQECGIALYYCAHAPASLLPPNMLSY
jgi:hypothetical protein